MRTDDATQDARQTIVYTCQTSGYSKELVAAGYSILRYSTGIAGYDANVVVGRQGLAYALSGSVQSEGAGGIAILSGGSGTASASSIAIAYGGSIADVADAGVAITINKGWSDELAQEPLDAVAAGAEGALLVFGHTEYVEHVPYARYRTYKVGDPDPDVGRIEPNTFYTLEKPDGKLKLKAVGPKP